MTHSFEVVPGKDLLIKKMMETIPKLQRRFQSEDDEEKAWLIRNCSNPVVVDFLEESTVMMLHVIDAIGQLEPVNGTTISKQFGIPKGSVSKITRKLVEKQIIRTQFLPDNKKEVLFLTTPLGKEIFNLHQALHLEINKGIHRFLQRYEADELSFLIRGLEDTLEASWVGSESPHEEEPHVSVKDEELGQILDMLTQLDTPSLKKAKTILKDVFFTTFEE